LGDGAGDVVDATVFVFGDGDARAGPDGVDLRLNAADDIDWSAKVIGDPRGFLVGGIPEATRTLNDGLNLGGG